MTAWENENMRVIHAYTVDQIVMDTLDSVRSYISSYDYPVGLMSYGGFFAPGTFIVVSDMEELAGVYYEYLVNSGIIYQNNDDLYDAMDAFTIQQFLDMFDIHENVAVPARE